MKQLWIIVQLADTACAKTVCQRIGVLVVEMGGEVVRFGGIGDVVALTTFPHRKYKAVERAITAALHSLPMKRTMVAAEDPYVLREKTAALTRESFRRQDEIVGFELRNRSRETPP